MKQFALVSFAIIFVGAYALLPSPESQTALGGGVGQAFQALGFTLPLWAILMLLAVFARRVSRRNENNSR